MAIPTLVISKDRPAQLDLLIRSLDKNANGLFNLTVLFKASNDEYAAGYDKLKQLWPKVFFIPEWEKDSWQQLYKWIELQDYINNNSNFLTAFFTDDCIFYRPCDVWEDDLLKLFSMQNMWTFTYRLGYNIEIQDYTVQNTTDRPRMFIEKHNVLIYDYKNVRFDHSFGWPVGLDGYVWRTKDLKNLLEGKSFNNFCRLEGLMIEQYKSKQPSACMMGCPFKSNVFVQQINVVHNDKHWNIGKFTPSVQQLNEEFLKGKRPSLESMDFSGVNCTHGEISFEFIK